MHARESMAKSSAVYSHHSFSVYLRESHVDQVEPALQSLGDNHSAATRWTHGSQQMHALLS